MGDYKPISCDFYDELEALATLGRNCEIVFRADNDGKSVVQGRIKDLYTGADKVEYMRLDNGLEIRLDRVISADGKRLDSYC